MELKQFNWPIWPVVKRIFNGWDEMQINGQLVPVYRTAYLTYVRKEHQGVFYLQTCMGQFISKKGTNPELHNERALNSLTTCAYFADKIGLVDTSIMFEDGKPAYIKHEDQRSERDFILSKHQIDIEPKAD
jgi:hypothetical protein